ncbi:MAG TPA: hypothetical protein VHF22_07135, partial [Planctomycetota bacterium]|nr:hypothetical protein [Planctomycetota bacterium]
MERNPFLGALAAILLAPALLFVPHFATGAAFSAADVRGGFMPYRGEGFPRARNWHLVDPCVQFEGWDRFTDAELAAGRAPLWNPREGAGVPHLANAQSAVFFPLTHLPGLLGARWGLLLRAYLRVALALGFAYALWRDLGCRRAAALFGGVAFAFSGAVLLWLPWPQTNVTIFLPLLCWCARRAADPRRGLAGALWPLPPVVALQFLGGHPETSLLIVLAATALFVWTLAGEAGLGRRERLARFAAFAAAGLLGGIMAGAHLAPFLDYLRSSSALEARAAGIERGKPLLNALRLIAPTFLGHPVDRTEWAPPSAMLLGSGIGYVGIAPLVLAFVPTSEPGKRRARRFFAGLAAAGLLATYAIWPVGEVVARVPVLRLGLDDRFAIWFVLGAAGLGALGLDAAL